MPSKWYAYHVTVDFTKLLPTYSKFHSKVHKSIDNFILKFTNRFFNKAFNWIILIHGPIRGFVYKTAFEAPSTRIRIRLYPQTFCCGLKSLRVHTYPDSLRFRPSTRIRENDTNPQCMVLTLRLTCTESLLIRKFSLHSSGTTIWFKNPAHQACVRPGRIQNLRRCAWRFLFIRFKAAFLPTGIARNLISALRFL